ncbi:Methyltransferase domain-containing protein [Oscillospiraceae bacterium]|nr:Methyltransferase domain-containing protein [Oscillospiraceae bacterium]
MNIEKLYTNRFDPEEQKKKIEMWKVLCDDFFSRYIPENATVLDPAAGYCEFINNITIKGSGKRIASDLNSEMPSHAADNVETHIASAASLDYLEDCSVDVIYISNFLEHIRTKEEVLTILSEFKRVLKPGGILMALQPNIRFAYDVYWDFFDHYTALSDKSYAEALALVGGFRLTTMIPRFMPYTTKGKLPVNPFLIRMYLKFRPAWNIMGKQFFAVAVKE